MLEVKSTKQKKYCSKCGEVLEVGYIQNYCRTCKAEYNQRYVEDNKEYNKQYREDNREYYKEYQKQYYKDNIANKKFIYFIESRDRTLYIGSCKGKYRVIYHLKGQSHLEALVQDWAELGVAKVRYIDVTEIVNNDDERLYIEKLYIDMYKPLLNDAEIRTDLDISIMERLEDIVYNEYVEFEEIDIKKATSCSGEVTFNFKDLILI